MIPIRVTLALMLVMVAMLMAAGCATTPDPGNQIVIITQTTVVPTMQESKALYKVTISQPEGSHADSIKMDADVYNSGEVIEFYVVNEGSESMLCDVLPSYIILMRMDDGSWKSLPEPSATATGGLKKYEPGSTSRTFRFTTFNWSPGQYRIYYCGVFREFILRGVPKVTAP